MRDARPKREGVMLAYPVDEGRISRLGEQFFVQPKLNGERARVEWFHGEPVLISSYGNAYAGLEHIQRDLLTLAKTMGECRFDGELYVHGGSWSRIRSAASRKVNASKDAPLLQYHIFDIQDEEQMQLSRSLNLLKHWVVTPSLRRVETSTCRNDGWAEACQGFIDAGYEGIILRSTIAHYVTKRNVCLLKYKPTESDLYTIDEVLEAISKEGEPKDMVGAFLVHGDDGTIFKVGAGKMTHKERKRLWQKRQILTGLLLHVKHEKLRTVNSVPIAAVALAIHEEVVEELSACCAAPFYEDTDICTSCKDHG